MWSREWRKWDRRLIVDDIGWLLMTNGWWNYMKEGISYTFQHVFYYIALLWLVVKGKIYISNNYHKIVSLWNQQLSDDQNLSVSTRLKQIKWCDCIMHNAALWHALKSNTTPTTTKIPSSTTPPTDYYGTIIRHNLFFLWARSKHCKFTTLIGSGKHQQTREITAFDDGNVIWTWEFNTRRSVSITSHWSHALAGDLRNLGVHVRRRTPAQHWQV